MLPVDAASLDEAHAAIDLWEFYSGKTLDPTQRLTVEVMMAVRADGTWAASTTGREMPRQNGKGDEIEVPEFWGLVKLHEAIAHTIHDAVLLATQAQERMLSLFDHRDLRRLIDAGQVWKGVGQQMIKLSTGGQIWYRTRTGGGLRGVDKIDRLVVDEAQHATPEHLNAMTSILKVAPDPQLNALGTAGLEGKSAWWWGVRKRALSANPGAFGYVGHTAEQLSLDADGRVVQALGDIQDRQLWIDTNPGSIAGGRGQGIAFLEEELWRLGEEGFAQEHLCVWAPDPGAGDGPSIIPNWDELADAEAVPVSAVQWALAVSPDRRWASVGVAGRTSEGKLYVAWREHRAMTSWVVDTVVEMFEAFRHPIRVHKSGPEGSFIGPLRERGVEVVEVSTAEVAQATGQVLDAAANGQLVHVGQPSMRKAVSGAVLRTSSDGAAVLSQVKSSVEITPFEAVVVAAGGVPADAEVDLLANVW